MKFPILTALLIFAITTNAAGRWEGATGYGYSVGKMIERYEDKSNGMQTHIDATLDFTHVFYANALAVEMVRRNNSEVKSYYCEDRAAKNPTKEIELFISWTKLQAAKDESILKDPITTLYPIYLMAMYPISNCGGAND